jgi:hypothetical protein
MTAEFHKVSVTNRTILSPAGLQVMSPAMVMTRVLQYVAIRAISFDVEHQKRNGRV